MHGQPGTMKREAPRDHFLGGFFIRQLITLRDESDLVLAGAAEAARSIARALHE
jgi:hypothetical protein